MNRDFLVTWPSRVLTRKSRPIGKIDAEVKQLAKDMMSVVRDWGNHRPKETGVALAAVQIGQLHRVVVVRKSFHKKDSVGFKTYLNPEVVKAGGKIVEQPEGCLSVKDVYGLVPRYSEVTVRAMTLTGKTLEFNASGFLARVFQHETDHTNGKLFFGRVKNNQFYNLTAKGEFEQLTEEEITKSHFKRP